MRLRKWLTGVLIMAEVTAALSACGKQDERIRTAEQLLNQKYGEEFSVTSYDGQEMMASYYEVTAYANEHPTLPFEASVNSDGSAVGAKRWSDLFPAECSVGGTVTVSFYDSAVGEGIPLETLSFDYQPASEPEDASGQSPETGGEE
jgi:hypothetical protein